MRYDGTDRRFDFVVRTLARRFELVPVCPEVEIGLGVPRAMIQLEGDPDAPRLVASDSGRDLTTKMARWAKRRAAELVGLDLAGYVFKRGSPSCGIAGVKVWVHPDHPPRRLGVGLFAQALRRALPELPVEDEGRLQQPGHGRRFVVRVLAYDRWRCLARGGPSPAELRAFHARERRLRLKYGGRRERVLSLLVARFVESGDAVLLAEYGRCHLEALARRRAPTGTGRTAQKEARAGGTR